MGFNTFDQMYHTSVVPIIDYGSGICGHKQYGDGDRIQFSVIRYFLGVPSKAPLLSLEGDMGYYNKNVCNIDATKCFCANLRNADWKNSVITKPKLQTYVTFKENMQTESYIKYCMLRKRRSLFAQLRLGILPLHVETGRFRYIKKMEKKLV